MAAKCDAGVVAFSAKPPPPGRLAEFDATGGVRHAPGRAPDLTDKRVVIAAAADSAVDWALAPADIGA